MLQADCKFSVCHSQHNFLINELRYNFLFQLVTKKYLMGVFFFIETFFSFVIIVVIVFETKLSWCERRCVYILSWKKVCRRFAEKRLRSAVSKLLPHIVFYDHIESNDLKLLVNFFFQMYCFRLADVGRVGVDFNIIGVVSEFIVSCDSLDLLSRRFAPLALPHLKTVELHRNHRSM